MGKLHAFRLQPGADLKKEIQKHVQANNIMAGWIACGIGSLTEYHIRFANQPAGAKALGYFEIISLAGTVSVSGSHIHIAVSYETGNTIGGHLLDGNIIYTTAEIIIQEADDLSFFRENDAHTGSKELVVKKKDT